MVVGVFCKSTQFNLRKSSRFPSMSPYVLSTKKINSMMCLMARLILDKNCDGHICHIIHQDWHWFLKPGRGWEPHSFWVYQRSSSTRSLSDHMDVSLTTALNLKTTLQNQIWRIGVLFMMLIETHTSVQSSSLLRDYHQQWLMAFLESRAIESEPQVLCSILRLCQKNAPKKPEQCHFLGIFLAAMKGVPLLGLLWHESFSPF